MSTLADAYQKLVKPWTQDELADHYRHAKRRGEQRPESAEDHIVESPMAMLATAVPACAALSVAIHVIHMLPDSADPRLFGELIANAEANAALAIHRFDRSLELDGRAHHYAVDDWLPTIHDLAGPLLTTARIDHEPPSLIVSAQDGVRWLSRGLVDLGNDDREATSALADGLAQLLALYVFACSARERTDGP